MCVCVCVCVFCICVFYLATLVLCSLVPRPLHWREVGSGDWTECLTQWNVIVVDDVILISGECICM